MRRRSSLSGIGNQGFTHGAGQQPIPVHVSSEGSIPQEQTSCELYAHVQLSFVHVASQMFPNSSQRKVVHMVFMPPVDPVAVPPQ